ncbi:phage antirepressor KilAC domain-containing protein [Sphingomonas fuzhouensis]|uniref:phage antirepressor KilAC domain-containing protein n=1 Tax=Sphingomonas fuzhouensis TaxID=3106033 RepID=UPI002AFFD5EB|nr:phage antirepressor KilAC domain-containing protein [Sphingomonas sp. SGZ-02]
MSIIPFQFDTTPVRAVERGGQAWFVAADVCAALGITSHRDAIARLDTDERGSVEVDTPGGRQTVAAINEAGLYTLTLRSRDAMTPGAPAHRFRKWVTGEVLPALRRDGAYGGATTAAALNDPAALRGLLLGYSERVIALEDRNTALEGQNAALTPKAEALDRIGSTEGSMNITAAAKVIKVGPRELHDWLRSNGWTYRRPDCDRVLAYQAKVDAGYLEHRLVKFQPPGQPERSTFQVMVTAKGVAKLAAIFAEKRRAA